MSDPAELPEEFGAKQVATWLVRHPASSLFILAVLSLFVVQPASKISSPGFIVMLFGAGAYPFVGVLSGFVSLFGRQFLTLRGGEKLRVVALSLVLLVTSSGAFLFFWTFLAEYYAQITCYGAGCAQGGIAVTICLPVAWFSYVITRILCNGFARLSWWPIGFIPKFP